MKTYNVIRVSNQNTSFDVIGGEVKIGKDNNGNYVVINDKKIYGLSRIEYICKVKVINEKDEKELKALEIIKEKEVNVKLFILSATTMIVDVEKQTISKQAQLEMYNYGVIDNTSFVRDYSKCLTEEEYDLLKEVLL